MAGTLGKGEGGYGSHQRGILTCYQTPLASSEKLGDTPLSTNISGAQKGSLSPTSPLIVLKPPVKVTLLPSPRASSEPVRPEGDILCRAEWKRPHTEGRKPGDLRGAGSCLSADSSAMQGKLL